VVRVLAHDLDRGVKGRASEGRRWLLTQVIEDQPVSHHLAMFNQRHADGDVVRITRHVDLDPSMTGAGPVVDRLPLRTHESLRFPCDVRPQPDRGATDAVVRGEVCGEAKTVIA
jgi:hypothetical protein